uniref:Olfactory receptor n=1 Tax=Pelusios castaneus TaxID=367368 RepID=A0A8C8RWS0_9SAUR
MSSGNDTKFQHVVFYLNGMPGLKDVNVWISIPFGLVYLTSIRGNSIILFIIKSDPTLNEPMYFFLSMLAITDLGISISTMPTTLGLFMVNSREISHDACFAQMFFIHMFSVTESAVLLSMAFDRFVAICNPLRYESILIPSRIAKMGLISLGVALTLPYPINLKQHQYCHDNVLSNSYCIHVDVMKMACSDIRVNIIYGLFLALASDGLDFLLILLSYIMILKTVLSITSHEGCLKALNTSISHICIVLIFYMPGFVTSLIYRFVKISSPLVQIVMGYVRLLIPPLMNPIVYSINTKPIRVRIIKFFIK